MTTLYLFQSDLDDELDPDLTTDEAGRQPRQRFCCAVCGAYISDDRFKTSIDGRHIHTRSNPLDQRFSFGCFSAAPGSSAYGTPTDEFSWFSACRWRFAHCGRCGVQLGWQFSGAQSFYALVLEQLMDCDREGD